MTASTAFSAWSSSAVTEASCLSASPVVEIVAASQSSSLSSAPTLGETTSTYLRTSCDEERSTSWTLHKQVSWGIALFHAAVVEDLACGNPHTHRKKRTCALRAQACPCAPCSTETRVYLCPFSVAAGAKMASAAPHTRSGHVALRPDQRRATGVQLPRHPSGRRELHEQLASRTGLPNSDPRHPVTRATRGSCLTRGC